MKKERPFKLRLGILELRACNDSLGVGPPWTRAEIVQWEGKTCFTIAHFVEAGDGFDLNFVGERPLSEKVDWNTFKELIKIGHKALECI